MKLVLFDIDGTLLDSGKQPRRAFSEALVEVYGEAGAIDTYSFSGRTDPRIMLDLLLGAGRSRAEVLARLPEARDAYLDRLDALLERERMRLLPGLPALLDALAARADIALGLLTGNFERGARIKLSRFGIEGYFPFGSYGDDQFDRDDLPPVALERAHAVTGRRFDPADALIVGDSLLDISCARAHGLKCLVVSTGWTSAEELAAAQPDWLVDDLTRVTGHEAFAEDERMLPPEDLPADRSP
ncbi:MAG TPA: HAD family hydrolase [Candidatus Krumholzibacteria bacterium]|nr:HAD family hydrolase [Candidatus Krumholzibacteria bacterium]